MPGGEGGRWLLGCLLLGVGAGSYWTCVIWLDVWIIWDNYGLLCHSPPHGMVASRTTLRFLIAFNCEFLSFLLLMLRLCYVFNF